MHKRAMSLTLWPRQQAQERGIFKLIMFCLHISEVAAAKAYLGVAKAAQVCTLLCRPEGVTLNEIRSETGWQAHTVRGFISRTTISEAQCFWPLNREALTIVARP